MLAELAGEANSVIEFCFQSVQVQRQNPAHVLAMCYSSAAENGKQLCTAMQILHSYSQTLQEIVQQ